MTLVLSDSLWFIMSTFIFVVWLTSSWVMMWGTSRQIKDWFNKHSPSMGLSYSAYGVIWFALYALEVPGFTFLIQDVNLNYTYWLTGLIFGLVNLVANLLWVFSISFHANLSMAFCLHLLSLGSCSVKVAMAYSMTDNTAGGLLTPQVAFLVYGLIVGMSLYKNASNTSGSAGYNPYGFQQGYPIMNKQGNATQSIVNTPLDLANGATQYGFGTVNTVGKDLGSGNLLGLPFDLASGATQYAAGTVNTAGRLVTSGNIVSTNASLAANNITPVSSGFVYRPSPRIMALINGQS